MELKRYQQLKKQVAETNEEANRAEGALDQIMQQLKSEFNCTTIQQAETELKKLQQKQKQAEQKYKTELEKFEEQYESIFDESE